MVSHIQTSKKTKTYNRRDSQMVTHSSTSRPVQCLCMAERTEYTVVTHLTYGNSSTPRECEFLEHVTGHIVPGISS
jgi:hypothetical protein